MDQIVVLRRMWWRWWWPNCATLCPTLCHIVVVVVARSSLIKSLSLLLISLTPKTVGSLGRMVAMVTLVGEYYDTGDTRGDVDELGMDSLSSDIS